MGNCHPVMQDHLPEAQNPQLHCH